MRDNDAGALALVFTVAVGIASLAAAGWSGYRAWQNWDGSSLFVRIPLTLFCFSLMLGLAQRLLSLLGFSVVAIITSVAKPRR